MRLFTQILCLAIVTVGFGLQAHATAATPSAVFAYDNGPAPYPPSPYPYPDPMPMPGPNPIPLPPPTDGYPREYQCFAEDNVGGMYFAEGDSYQEAAQNALDLCEINSSNGCHGTGCAVQ